MELECRCVTMMIFVPHQVLFVAAEQADCCVSIMFVPYQILFVAAEQADPILAMLVYCTDHLALQTLICKPSHSALLPCR